MGSWEKQSLIIDEKSVKRFDKFYQNA